MRAEKITREKYLVLLQVRTHRLRPVNPGYIDKLQCLIAQRKRLAVIDRDKSIIADVQQINQHTLALRISYHFGIGIQKQDVRDAAGVVLFPMMRNNIIDSIDASFDEIFY